MYLYLKKATFKISYFLYIAVLKPLSHNLALYRTTDMDFDSD